MLWDVPLPVHKDMTDSYHAVTFHPMVHGSGMYFEYDIEINPMNVFCISDKSQKKFSE